MVINIMNLYKYKEILENINKIVIFSIPIISLILYTLNKRKVMILENLIYIGEFFIYLYLNSYIIIGNINLISMILILKFVIILTLKEKLKINNFLYKFILILGLLYVCNIKVEYSILINIILNIVLDQFCQNVNIVVQLLNILIISATGRNAVHNIVHPFFQGINIAKKTLQPQLALRFCGNGCQSGKLAA